MTLLLAAPLLMRPTGVCADGIDGVLVLRNGSVLEGTIARSGDRYQVESAHTLLQVPARQVATFCHSKSEAYEVLRLKIEPTSADAHAALAKWCLKHDLVDPAQRELEAAGSLNAAHAALPLLRRQLRVTRERLHEQTQHVSRRDGDGATPTEPAQVASDFGATPASFGEPTALAEPGAGAEIPATIGLRDATIAADWESPAPIVQLTDEDRATFVRSIQPMLVQSCSAAGCHQPDSSQRFQLDRLAVTAGGHPTIFARNLDAVIGQIRAETPDESPLMRMAQRRHGVDGAASTPLGRRQAALLAEWIADVVAAEPTNAAARDEASVKSAEKADADRDAELQIDQPAAASEEHSGQPLREPTFDELDSLNWGDSEVEVRDPVGLPTYSPRDPFDPEIYNRQFGPRHSSPESEATTS